MAAVQVFVYYELGKYYQNHKRYVRSRDDNQMAGKGSGSGKCAPEQYVGGNPDPSLPAQGAVTPCGLIAWSFFNDSFGDAASVVGPNGAPSSVPLDVSPSRSRLQHLLCQGNIQYGMGTSLSLTLCASHGLLALRLAFSMCLPQL